MNYKNKEVLITGAGFVSHHLLAELKSQGARITIMDRNLEHLAKLASQQDITLIKGDIRHLHQNLSFDYVFHTSAVTHVGYGEANPIQTYDDNVIATLNLLKHVQIRERFVFTSSAVVYSNKNGKHTEDEVLNPISLYGQSKIAGEALVKHFATKNKFDCTIFRFFNIYGEGQKEFFLVPQILKEAKEKRHITLWNTQSKRDFIYIGDIAKGIGKLAQNADAANQTINMGTGIETSSGELAALVVELLGKDIEIEDKHIYDPASLATLIADTSKAEWLGFRATTTLMEGLTRMIECQNQTKTL